MEEVKVAAGVAEAAPQAKKVRAQAQYPYFDMTASLEVAKRIHENAGGACEPDQLASYLSYQSTKSGTFQTRLSAAKQFGFVRSDGGKISVTERAMKILSPVLPEDAVAAKADAFLSVDLFNKVYEKYKGSTIPPKIGMRNLFTQSYGLSEDRAEPAVRVLFDSAEEAGFFPSNDQTRLVRPIPKPSTAGHRATHQEHPPAQQQQHHTEQRTGGGGGEGPPGVHTAIIGLLRELPPPGTEWPKKSKDRFVKAFLATLDFVYPHEEQEGQS